MKELDYIDAQLNSMKELDIFVKYDTLIKLIYYFKNNRNKINHNDIEKTGSEILSQITSLRYGLAHNKATDGMGARLDLGLVYLALEIAREVAKPKDVARYINSVLYYETNEDERQAYLKEIESLNK